MKIAARTPATSALLDEMVGIAGELVLARLAQADRHTRDQRLVGELALFAEVRIGRIRSGGRRRDEREGDGHIRVSEIGQPRADEVLVHGGADVDRAAARVALAAYHPRPRWRKTS